jgi:organic radical activating enzyme
MKKIFCTLPFNKVFLGPDGGIKTCCAATDTIGNLNENTIEEILQGDKAKSIRKKFIDNEWPEQCEQFCKSVATTINTDATEMRYDDYTYDNAIKYGSSFFELKTTDLRWSNLCNLICNYCEPYFSSRWAQLKEIDPKFSSRWGPLLDVKVNDVRKNNTDGLIDFVIDSATKSPLDCIFLLGGEPLLQKQNMDLLKRLETFKESDQVISITTNLSTPLENNKIAQLLLGYKNVHWHISMDNIGKRFEYVRDGASWEVLTNNIKYLQTKTDEMWIWPIYSIYSATNMMELYDWANNNNIKNIYWQVVSPGGPFPIYVKNLSKELKLKAINEIDNVIEKYGHKYDTSRILSYKENMLIKYLDRIELLDYKEYHRDLEQNVLKDKQYTFAELWPDL